MRNITKIFSVQKYLQRPMRIIWQNYPRVRSAVCRISGGSSTIRFRMPMMNRALENRAAIMEGIANQWHVTRSAEMDSSTGLSITVSCNDIDGALQFVSDLLEPEIIKLRFWGKEGDDYCVDENGLFYLTEEQEKRWMTSEEKRKHFCFYSYFPRVEGRLSDGINAFSLEYQTTEFYKNQPEDIQECFSAYGVTNYVDMIGNNEAPGAWYPMYSYTTSLSANSPAGQVRDRMDAVKHKWLPQVIMAEDFETAWEQYMKAYDSCNPEIYYQMLQLEVEKRVKG